MAYTSIFEEATRLKLRFEYRGSLSVEDLWDLSVQKLDEIFKKLNAELKASQEESLLQVKSNEDKEIETKIAIIKHIVEVKQTESEVRRNEKARKENKQKIFALIDEKENEALRSMSLEDLKAKAAEYE